MNLSRFQGQVTSLYKKATYTYSWDLYKNYLREIKELNVRAFEKLKKVEFPRWAHVQCLVRRYNFMTSYAAEVLNARLCWAKKLYVCSLLECVCNLYEQWFHGWHTTSESMEHVLTPAVVARLRKTQNLGQCMHVIAVGSVIYNVKGGVCTFVIDLSNRTCTCWVFQLYLMSCSHATKVIGYKWS